MGAGDGDSLTGGFDQYARLPGTLIFLMGLSNLEKIVENLIKYGKDPRTPAAVVTNGTCRTAGASGRRFRLFQRLYEGLV